MNTVEKYIGIEDKKVYYLVPLVGYEKKDALKAANKKIKVSSSKLKVKIGFVWKDQLFWKKPLPEAKSTWVVWKE